MLQNVYLIVSVIGGRYSFCSDGQTREGQHIWDHLFVCQLMDYF